MILSSCKIKIWISFFLTTLCFSSDYIHFSECFLLYMYNIFVVIRLFTFREPCQASGSTHKLDADTIHAETTESSVHETTESGTSETHGQETNDNDALTQETTVLVYSLGGTTIVTCIVGFGLNIINLKALGIMNDSVIYTYFKLVVKCDTVRLVSCGMVALVMMIFKADSMSVDFDKTVTVQGVLMFLHFSALLFCIDVSCILQLSLNIDRLIAMRSSNSPRSKSDVTQNPKTIALVSVVISALLFLGRLIGRYWYRPLYTPLTQITVFLPLVVKVITVVVIVVLLVYVVRHTKSQGRILPAQDGPRYLRHKRMLSTTRSVMVISILSIALSFGAAAIPLHYTLTGEIEQFQTTADTWCKGMIIYTFLECLGCINFFFYMALITDFRVAFKKISFKRWNVCKSCNNQVAPAPSEQITDAQL